MVIVYIEYIDLFKDKKRVVGFRLFIPSLKVSVEVISNVYHRKKINIFRYLSLNDTETLQYPENYPDPSKDYEKLDLNWSLIIGILSKTSFSGEIVWKSIDKIVRIPKESIIILYEV